MKFSDVIKEFDTETVSVYFAASDCNLLSVKFLLEKVAVGFESEIYVAEGKDFCFENIPDNAINFIISGPLDREIPKERDLNLIVLKEEVSSFSALNRISDLLDKEKQFDKADHFLKQIRELSYVNKYDFNEVIDIIYGLFQNPFSVMGVNGEIINYKNIYEINDYLAGFLKRGEADAVAKGAEEVISIVSESMSPVMLHSFMGAPLKHIINRICINDKVVAFFFLAEMSNPLSESDFPLVEMVCQWLGSELKRDPSLLETKSYAVGHFLTDILDNNFGTAEEVEKRAEQLRIGQKPYHYLIVTDLNQIRNKKLNLDNVKNVLRTNLSGADYLTYKDYIVFYLNTEKKDYFTLEKIDQIERFCAQLDIKIGISYAYTDLKETHMAFLLAEEALQTGSRLHGKENVYQYQDYALYHITKQIAGEDAVERFCHSKLLDLISYDQEHNTEYTYTLYILLRAAGKKVVAADELHVHRSTLLYRLEKIDEITGGLDLYDTPTVTRLYMSFAFLIDRGILDPSEYSRL